MPLTALLVDDERLARAQLRTQLTSFPDVEVVAEADSVPSALDAVQRFQPQVVFLDIQMPGESGFDFLEQARGDFKLVFVTAFDQFAVRAFEINALDYLLKPVGLSRLATAVERLTKKSPANPASLHPLSLSDYLFVAGRSARFLKVSAIKYILAAGAYSEIFTSDRQKHTLLQTIKVWEERLPRANFARIHRSCIVNLDFVTKVEDLNSGYQVTLRDQPTPLPVSRRYAVLLKARFS